MTKETESWGMLNFLIAGKETMQLSKGYLTSFHSTSDYYRTLYNWFYILHSCYNVPILELCSI